MSGSTQKCLREFAAILLEQHLGGETKFHKTTVHYKGKEETYYAYCAIHRIKGYEQKQRLVISYKNGQFNSTPRFSISNRTHFGQFLWRQHS